MVALNRYSAQFMANYLAVPSERVHVIPPGLNLDGHAAVTPPGTIARPEPAPHGLHHRLSGANLSREGTAPASGGAGALGSGSGDAAGSSRCRRIPG